MIPSFMLVNRVPIALTKPHQFIVCPSSVAKFCHLPLKFSFLRVGRPGSCQNTQQLISEFARDVVNKMRGPKGEDLAVNDGHRVSRSVHGAASPTSRSRIYGRAILRALPPVMSLSKPGGEETEAISPHMCEDTIIILLLLLCTLVSLLGFASVASCGRGGSAVSESESDVDDRSATRGMKEEALQALPALLYSPTTVLPRAGVDCPICLTDFVEGEKIRMLPKCGHGFHVDCIDTWLLSNSSCPICRHCLLDVCEKAPMVSVPRDSRSQALSTSEQAASTSQSASNRGPVELQRTKDDHSIKLTNLQQPRN